MNPNIKIKVVWANTWFDPAKEGDAAKALLDQGVDMLAQHTDSLAPIQQAEARGRFGFGQASDMERFAQGPAHGHHRQLGRLLCGPDESGARRHLEVRGHGAA